MNIKIEFPPADEYPDYAEMYMKLVDKEKDLIEQLMESLEETIRLIVSLSDDELNFRYKNNKWSIKEVMVHIIDDERIYGYRSLAFARNDKTSLPGFEQDDYIENSDTSDRPIQNILEEYRAVRRSTISLFTGFSEKALLRIGLANGNKTSVRALGYHILGHELHHMKLINEVYLKTYRLEN